MAPLSSLPAPQRAVLSLVLQKGRSYAELAGLLRLEVDAVRERARLALDALGDDTGAAAPSPQQRAALGDYLLGQDPAAAAATRAYLDGSAAARDWARAVAGELAGLDGADLPAIPAEPARGAEPPAAEAPEAEPPAPDPPAAGAPAAEPSTANPSAPDPPAAAVAADPPGPADPPVAPAPAADPPAPAPPPLQASAPAPGPVANPPASSRSPAPTAAPVSRRGGAVLLAGAALAVAAVVLAVLLLRGGGSSHRPRAAATTAAAPATGTATTPTTTATPAASVAAQITLTAATGTAVHGLAAVIKRGSQRALAIAASGLHPTSAHLAYGVWLFNSRTDSQLIGFVPPVKADGKISAAAALPTSAGRYHRLVLTEEAGTQATRPGRIVLSGPIPAGAAG